MKLGTIILTVLISYNASAFDFDSLKKKLRPFAQKVIGKENSAKFFGKEEEKIQLPDIPEITVDAKSTYTLSKDSDLYKQGGEYNQLTDEKKKPYRLSFLEELFLAVRKDRAKDSDIAKWLNTMEQGSSREGVYRALVLDRVYNSLESFEESPSDEAISFTVSFYDNYIKRVVSKNALGKLNTFSIKRIVTEKALEILEVLEKNPDDVYRWYAVVSSHLAQKFSGQYKTDIRRNTNREVHYSWAQNVPYQHLKSELIIKLHLAYNSYM
jgi:hypothetical protein